MSLPDGAAVCELKHKLWVKAGITHLHSVHLLTIGHDTISLTVYTHRSTHLKSLCILFASSAESVSQSVQICAFLEVLGESHMRR